MGLDDFKSDDAESREFRGNQHTQDNDNFEKLEIISRVQEIAEKKESTPVMRDIINEPDMPSSGTLVNMFGSWNSLLEEAGLQTNQVGQYSENEKSEMLDDIRRCYGEVEGNLTVRRYIELGDYAHTTIKRKFGSWTDALNKAGVEHGTKHGQSIECKCGARLDSVNEKVVGDILHDLDLSHTVHKDVPNSNYKTDFYIDSVDLWVEVDGYKQSERPNSEGYKDKKEHYEKLKLDYIEIKVPYTLNESKVKKLIKDKIN